MFCRYLDINIIDKLVICVPQNLKDEILDPQVSQRIAQREEQLHQDYLRHHRKLRLQHDVKARKEKERLGLDLN